VLRRRASFLHCHFDRNNQGTSSGTDRWLAHFAILISITIYIDNSLRHRIRLVDASLLMPSTAVMRIELDGLTNAAEQ
jgi:hypothetical protein